jgi:uncharacterized protein YhjY with autotransporter beta-barrel domain
MNRLFKTIIVIFFFNFNYASAETITMPSSLTADTTAFVLLSSSGTTPSISGFSGNLLVTAVASTGNVKITTTSNILQASGYCGYDADSTSNAPSNCNGASLTEIGFIGTQANINTALATLSFKGDGSTGSPTITLSVAAAGNNYNSDNGHYYKVVDNTSNITWTAAKTAAEASTLNGLQGYLASVSSFAENTFIKSKTNGDSWIGGSDKDVEGCWKWTSGPDAGKIFQNGNHGDIGGVSSCVVDTGYAVQTKTFSSGEFGWNTNEPNDNATGEDYAYIKTDGSWNDYKNVQSVTKYVIEYGGSAGDTPTSTGLTTLTISSLEASGSTHQAFNNKQLSGIVEAQTESIKRHMYNSTNSIMDRMEQFRRTGDNKGLQLNDFRLTLADQGVNEHTHAKLAKHYLQKYSKEVADKQGLDLTDNNIEKFISELPLSKYMKQEFNLKPNKWAMWSVGSLSKGGLDFSIGQLGRTNESNGFTLGADLDWSDNSLLGFALRDETEDVKVSTNGTKYKSDNSTLSFYNTWKANDKNYVDAFIGFGHTKQATTRIVDIINKTEVTGELKSKQAFGAIKYNFKKDFKLINLNNYSKVNFGYTMFDAYSEKGDSNLKLNFDDRDLKSYAVSVGSLIESKIDLRSSKLIPFLRIDITEDLTEGSSLKANYVSSSSNQYSKNISKDFSAIIRVETGFDWNFNNGWHVSTTLDRIDKDSFGHQNYIKFGANKSF